MKTLFEKIYIHLNILFNRPNIRNHYWFAFFLLPKIIIFACLMSSGWSRLGHIVSCILGLFHEKQLTLLFNTLESPASIDHRKYMLTSKRFCVQKSKCTVLIGCDLLFRERLVLFLLNQFFVAFKRQGQRNRRNQFIIVRLRGPPRKLADSGNL